MERNYAQAELPLLSQKVRYQEREIAEIKQDTKEFRQKVETKIEVLEEDLGELQVNYRESTVLLKQLMETTKEMNKKIEDIADKMERDSTWKKVIVDILKILITVFIVLLTGKYVQLS